MSALEEMFVESPRSEEICVVLNAVDADVCAHDRNPCLLRCGVETVRGVWTPIPYVERRAWLGEVIRLVSKEER